MKRCSLLLMVVLLACGDEASDTDAGASDSGRSDAGGGTDAQPGDSGFQGCGNFGARCAPTEDCATATCSFVPSSVDCAVACQNVSDLCGSGGGCAGPSICAGVLTNVAQCIVICEMEKAFSCGNATYGCYGANDSCESVAACLNCSD